MKRCDDSTCTLRQSFMQVRPFSSAIACKTCLTVIFSTSQFFSLGSYSRKPKTRETTNRGNDKDQKNPFAPYMSKIKVYLRVRPSLPGEFDVPGCFNCVELEDVSGNWIKFKKEGEQIRYFARVWGPQSTQEEMFRTIGVNTVNDVFEGYYGCIFVYGQTGTGKTFTLGCLVPGLEGIQPQCIRFVFDKIAKESHKYDVTVKQHYVQLYRDNVQDLLDITKDDLKIRMDEQTGANVEKVTMRDINCYEDSIALIREGDGNRVVANTKMNSASSRSHACLITEVWRKDKATGNTTFGRLYLIDLAGSERVSKSGVTDDAFKEAVAINKSLTTLGNCIAGLVNNEKVVSFRDSPLTRILQHSLTGHGRTSIVICIRPDSPNMQESLCTVKFGERAQKVEAQMTPASYRDNLLELMEKMTAVDRTNAELSATATSYKRWAAAIKASILEKEQLAKEKEVSVKEELDTAKKEFEAAKKELEEQWKKDEEAINSKTKAELERLREANSSVIKEIEAKVAEAEQQAREKCKAANKAVMADHSAIQKEHKKCLADLETAKSENSTDYHAKAKVLIAETQEKIKMQKKKLRGCRPSKFEPYNEPELRTKQFEFTELLDHLTQKKAQLQEKTANWDKKAMAKFQYDVTPEKQKDFLERLAKEFTRVPTPEPEPEPEEPAEDEESEAPPSSEPPPSTEASDSDSDSEDIPAEPPARDKKELLRTLEMDIRLGDMLEQTCGYLDYGTTCYTVTVSEADRKPSVTRRHVFLGKGRQVMIVCEVKPGTKEPDRNKVIDTIKLSDVQQVVLGQYTENYLIAVEGSPMVPQGTQMPQTSDKCSLSSLRVFFYRSISLINNKKKSMIDVVMNMDTDFEAWIVTFHRLTLKDPVWGGPLDIVSIKDAEILNDAERKLCIDTHIAPTVLLNTKKAMVENDMRLYYTLFDIRAISCLDLLHAQKLFTFFIEQGLIERHSVYHLRWMDLKREKEEEEAKKAALRALRVRLVNMIRYYRKSSFQQIQEFLRAAAGAEEETLNRLVADLGPEPSDEQVKEMQQTDNISDQSVDEALAASDAIAIMTPEQRRRMELQQQAQEREEAAQRERAETKARLVRFYAKYAPEKLKDVDKALQVYAGKEPEMFQTLVAKYGPEPPDPNAAAQGGAAAAAPVPSGTYKERLDRFFGKYAPSRVGDVDKLLAANKGKEAQMIATLVAKFGPEPLADEVVAAPAAAAAPAPAPAAAAPAPAAAAPAPAAAAPAATHVDPAAAPPLASTPAPPVAPAPAAATEPAQTSPAAATAPPSAAAAPVVAPAAPAPAAPAPATPEPATAPAAAPAAAPAPAAPAPAPASAPAPAAPAPLAMDHKSRLVRYFTKYAPQRVADSDKLLAAYKGKEEDLFKSLVAKFGPEPTE